MITFSLVGSDDESYAYAWHRDFAEHDRSVYPRTPEQFHVFVRNGMAWGAVGGLGQYVGLAYASREDESWEIGGLSVTIEARENGVGLLLAYLVLGHLLFEEDPLSSEPPGPIRVIVHVLEKNLQPRTIVEQILRFRCCGPVAIEADRLPGLPTGPDGFVHGDQFEIGIPETLEVLADWAANWDGRLRSGQLAILELREGITLSRWAEAFRRMAAQGTASPSNREISDPDRDEVPDERTGKGERDS